MKKIVIIGSPGAGKTTLAQALGRILNIKVIHLDRLFWKGGWQAISGDERIDILKDLVPATRWLDGKWIMEGTYLQSSEPRFEGADTIIFLDTHLFLCLGRVIQRHYAHHGQFRRDLPKECTDRLTLSRMLYVLTFSFEERKKLMKNLRSYTSKEFIHLYSPREVNNFVKKLEEQTTIGCLTPTFGQKVLREIGQQFHYIVNTIKAVAFFVRSCFALLLYTLSPKTFFSLRARLH
jgi:adenylate kinase family enzyme